jgi:hypothetical protein
MHVVDAGLSFTVQDLACRPALLEGLKRKGMKDMKSMKSMKKGNGN